MAKQTPELLKLQADLIAALDPFKVASADPAAFATTPDDPVIDPRAAVYQLGQFGTAAKKLKELDLKHDPPQAFAAAGFKRLKPREWLLYGLTMESAPA